ncbi:DUF3180 domain-containing protein [Sinosporangium siamense]|uniref:DUF3180 domain-containing protein n=1 Tax=Sinosporangium siamense TaxID=1367973 RepID=A0A919V800_9ACTN|nr:DUF3180 domain-containing protein [Sinosporangium siamense]GII95655.1 hypothetical protein Ssi02_58860 [Sinosporangium siamense]
MKPTRPGVLVAILLGFTLITWWVLQLTYSSLPRLPWTAIPTLLLLALGEAYTGWMTRARILRRPGTRPVEPLAVARLAALAKASAYGGALFGGFFGGFVLHTVEILDRETPRTDFFVASGSFLACVVLICAAAYLEYCCRVPKDQGPQRPEGD